MGTHLCLETRPLIQLNDTLALGLYFGVKQIVIDELS
jgi:hypothetical protein